jgi:hypothetical protein
LLNLPGELRNSIYEYVFSDTTLHISFAGLMGTTHNAWPIAKPLALLQTCRQLHTETKLLPYINSTIQLDDPDTLDVFVASRTPSQLKSLRTIELMIDENSWILRSRTESKCLAKLSGLKRIEAIWVSKWSDEVEDGLPQWREESIARGLRKWRPVFEVAIRVEGQDVECGDLLRRKSWASRAVSCMLKPRIQG